ncbi:MAG: DUF368 domain-containing protein, partial [Clostridia bacterium]|nr:DUF368 domain-containing protein [Clostridia bacterium]
DILRGVAIGVAFIIPGFSGGSVAAILGIYEKLVGAIADLFKNFKKNILILLPILLGMLLGIAALILPIQWGIKNYPIPTVTLFVGLAIGGLPSVTDKMKGGKIRYTHILAGIIPLLAAAALCFLPQGQEVNLFELNFGGYLLLVLIGIVGSCALVVPGISGSMLLLIFGYYNPLVQLVTEHLLHGDSVGICLLVVLCVGIGIVIGFFGISVLMKFLLKKFPRGTYFAIFGFIVGSIPAVYFSTAKDAGLTASMLSSLSPWYWVVSVLFLAIGIALSYFLVWYARKKSAAPKQEEEEQKETE